MIPEIFFAIKFVKNHKKSCLPNYLENSTFFVIQVSLVHPFLAKGEDSDTT